MMGLNKATLLWHFVVSFSSQANGDSFTSLKEEKKKSRATLSEFLVFKGLEKIILKNFLKSLPRKKFSIIQD